MRSSFKCKYAGIIFIILFCTALATAQTQQRPVRASNPMLDVKPQEYLDKIKLPDGFQIELFAENVEGARSMSISPSGVLYVGTFRARGSVPGKVYAIVDRNKDFKADEVITLASDLFMPNGVAFKDGDLYIAEINRILKLEKIEENLHRADLESFILQALKQEEYALALRLYYLSILKELSQRKAIHWKREKTNRQYVWEMRQSPLSGAFEEVTRIFEQAWYGGRQMDKREYQALEPKFRMLAGKVKGG